MPKKIAFLIICLMMLPKIWAQASSPTDAKATAILAEISRQKEKVIALNLPVEDANGVNSLLSRGERAAQSGHVYLSLHLLQYAIPLLAGYSFRIKQIAGGIVDLTALEKVWKQLGPELSARQRRLIASQKPPVAVQAIIERALTQVQPNYQASLLYGQEAGIESGLFYMGMAQGQLDFVTFCRSLKFSAPAASPLPSPAAELAAIEAEVLTAWQKFDTPEQHGSFIRVSSALKVAQDLMQERRASGVWLQTLEARRALASILTAANENRSAAELRAQSETARAQLSKAAGDQSLGWLFWQMAETALANDDLKSANATLHYVLPRYFQSLKRS